MIADVYLVVSDMLRLWAIRVKSIQDNLKIKCLLFSSELTQDKW